MMDGAARVCGDSGHSAGSPSSGNSPAREPYTAPETEAENATFPDSLAATKQPPNAPQQDFHSGDGPIKNPLCQGCHRSEVYSQHPEATVPSFCGAQSASKGNNDVSSRALVTESQQAGPDSLGFLRNLGAP